MTIDVADLRKRAERTFPQVYPSELTELLDAYEERDRLRAALVTISYRAPVAGSRDEYRRGQLDALVACRHIADRALEGRE